MQHTASYRRGAILIRLGCADGKKRQGSIFVQCVKRIPVPVCAIRFSRLKVENPVAAATVLVLSCWTGCQFGILYALGHPLSIVLGVSTRR